MTATEMRFVPRRCGPRTHRQAFRPRIEAPTLAHAEDAWTLAVAHRIRLMRIERDLSQEEVARWIGTHRSSMSLVESGCTRLRAWQLARIADGFGVTLERLTRPVPQAEGEGAR